MFILSSCVHCLFCLFARFLNTTFDGRQRADVGWDGGGLGADSNPAELYLQHIPSILLLLPFYLSRGLLGPGNPLFSQHGICFMEGELGILCGNFTQTDTEHSD